MDFSFLIPARNEMWLAKTIESVLAKMRGDSEIIAVLDGEWADPPIQEHPRLTLIHKSQPIGQRAATNLAARVAQGRYVCKLDAHCDIDEGFDVKLVTAGDQLGADVTIIPAQYNLHVFNWRCGRCGTETYQGPTPTVCGRCQEQGTVGGPFERVVYWDLLANGIPGRHVRSDAWRFDHDLHFQYGGPVRRDQRTGAIADVMSSIGACFVMRRDRFMDIGGLDESHGSWGQFGTEIACKSWLSGGRHVVHRETWYAHLFRTQGGDFGFPYSNPGTAVDRAREHSRRLWLENTWAGQTRPLSWLLEHFAPVRGWHVPDDPKKPETAEQQRFREQRLKQVDAAGRQFTPRVPRLLGYPMRTVDTLASAPDVVRRGVVSGRQSPSALPVWPKIQTVGPKGEQLTKGLVYYTDNRLDDDPVGHVVRTRLASIGLPIVCVSLKPLAFGTRNIVMPGERGQLMMFRQIRAGLEALDTDIAFLVEHDVLYSPEHFQFTPVDDQHFYYNQHRWQVSARDGKAVHYRASQTSGCCAYRSRLVDHYRKRVAYIEQHGWDRNIGYEPGTNRRSLAFDPHGAQSFWTETPNIDVRDVGNLSKSKWSLADFRNKANAVGWTEADAVPGWGRTCGRFDAFLVGLQRAAAGHSTD